MSMQNSKRPRAVALKRISFVGVRTDAMQQMRRFYEEFFGLSLLLEEKDFVAYATSDNSRIELFGLGYTSHTHFDTGPVCGYEVDDVHMAKRQLIEYGLEVMSGVDGDPNGTQWLHFRGPDGNIYALVRHRDKQSSQLKDE